MSQTIDTNQTIGTVTMTAKRRIPLFAVLFLLAVVTGALAWLGRELLLIPPGMDGVPFSYPHSARESGGGAIALSDKGERRIVGLAPDGTLGFVVNGGVRSRGFYSGRIIGFDSTGRFYLDDTIYDPATDGIAGRRLLRFSPTGRYLGEVFSLQYEGDAMLDWESHPIFMQMHGDTAFWFLKDADGTWTLNATDTVTGSVQDEKKYPGVDVYSAIGVIALPDGRIIMLDGDGQLLMADGDGSEPLVIPGQTRIRYPSGLALAPDGTVLVNDAKLTVYRFDPDRPEAPWTTVIDRQLVIDGEGPEPVMFQAVTASSSGDIIFCDEYSARVIRVHPDGSATSLSVARFGSLLQILRVGVWSVLILGIGFFVAGVVAMYVRIMRSQTTILVRQLSIMIPAITLMVLSVSVYVFQAMNSSLGSQLRDRLLHLAHQGAAAIDPADVASLDFRTRTSGELLSSDESVRIVTVLDRLVNLNEDPWDSSIYPYVYIRDGFTWWITGSFGYVEPYPYTRAEHLQVLMTGEYRYFRYRDVYGSWLSALAPVVNADGQPIAVFEISMRGESLDEAFNQFALRAALGGAGIVIAFLVLLSLFTTAMLRSVRQLHSGVSKVATGNYEIFLKIKSRDEMEELGNAFNGMSVEIKNYIERLAAFGRANARFVPKEFIESLGHESITGVRLGDQIQTTMTVLFSDIRDFTTISERLGPEGTMKLLNEYLSRMGPVIRKHGGFIDKYIGDAIMALFPRSPDDAASAILDMMSTMDDFNRDLTGEGRAPLHAGCAIHTGTLMLGIIGEAERYEGTAIADTVNLASRLESLTKYYGVHALVSGATAKHLKDRKVPLRFVDAVQVKGKDKSVTMYEMVGPGDPHRAGKLGSRTRYRDAFRAYAKADFTAAVAGFDACLEMAPGDAPALLMRDRCLRYQREGAPAGWRGVTVFSEK